MISKNIILYNNVRIFKWLTIFIILLILTIPAFSAFFINNDENNQNNNDQLKSESKPQIHRRTEFFFDFGEQRSPIMNGYTRITSNDFYNTTKGYGLLSNSSSYYVTPRGVPEFGYSILPRSWVYKEYATDLTVDGLREQNITFRVDLPNGTFRVRTWLGDLEKAVYSMNISYNSQWLVENADAFHTVHRSMYFKIHNYGLAVPYNRDVTVDNGTIIINVTGNDTAYWQELQVELAKDSPYSYGVWMSTGGKKYSTGTGPWRYIGGPFSNASVLGIEIYPKPVLPINGTIGSIVVNSSVTDMDVKAAVDHINNGNWLSAFSSWESASTKTLTGSNLVARAQIGIHLAGALQLDKEFSLLPKIEDDLTAALTENPSDKGVKELLGDTQEVRKGLHYFINRTEFDPRGRNHFYESNKGLIHLWNLDPNSPLYPKMILWCARALYTLDPHRWTSASGTARDLMESQRPLDPNNKYISFFLDTERDVPPTWNNWTSVISTTGEDDFWGLTNYTSGNEDAPEWAKILHEELCWLYDITDWWVDHRQGENGYLGGGWSDDVEFIGLFGFDALISEGADDKSLEGARKFVDGMLASGDVNMDLGFSAAFADTEHSAELTGDSLPMMIAIDFGNPRWLEFSMKTALLMRDLWMGENEEGNLQFKANYLSATKIGTGGQTEDSWINYRAALPARWVWWYSGDPEIEDIFLRWADTWVDAALSTEKSKPKGVIPAGLGWPDGEIGGHNAPSWYEAAHPAGSVNYDWERQNYKDYITDLLVSAFETTGNLTYIEPLRLEAEIAQDYLDNPVPRPDAGTYEWVGQILGQGAINRYQNVLDTYSLPGANPAATLWTRDDVVSSCNDGYNYIRKCYPLMTTEASATDRAAFIGVPNPFLIYTGGGVGGALLAPQYTYTGLGRDFAAMVQYANRTKSSILLYGFYSGTRNCGLVPWTLEPGATYRLNGGPDDNGDGIRDSTDQTVIFEFKSRGMVVPFNLSGDGEYILDIEMITNGTGRTLLPDPAWGEVNISVDIINRTITVPIHNVGGTNATNFEVILIKSNSTNQDVIAKTKIDDLPPPTNLLPSIIDIDLQVVSNTISHDTYMLVIDPYEKLDQITKRNDVTEVELNLSEIKVNMPPVITPYPVSSLVVMFENETTNFSISITDDDFSNLSFIWRFDGIIKDVNITYFEYNANYSSAGNYTVNITIVDNGIPEWVVNFEWDITVNDVNRPPIILNYIPKQELYINEVENGVVIFKINSTDPDLDDLTYNWYLDSKKLDNQFNSSYKFNYNFTSAGDYDIKVVVNDSSDNVSLTWKLQINNTNRAPNIIDYFPSDNITINDTSNITFSIKATDPDVDDVLMFRWYKNDSLISEEINDSFKYLSIKGENATHKISVEVFDGNNSSIGHIWFLTVYPVKTANKTTDGKENKTKDNDNVTNGDGNGNGNGKKDKDGDEKDDKSDEDKLDLGLVLLTIIIIIGLILTLLVLFILFRKKQSTHKAYEPEDEPLDSDEMFEE